MEKVNYQQLFILVARLLLTGVFVLAALPKIKDPVAFAASVNAFQVVSPGLANWIALVLPWLELVIGIGILLPPIKSSSGILIAVLLVAFIGLHISAWVRGLEIDCGCFGAKQSEKATNYLWLVTRNALLLCACLPVIFQDIKNRSKKFC